MNLLIEGPRVPELLAAAAGAGGAAATAVTTAVVESTAPPILFGVPVWVLMASVAGAFFVLAWLEQPNWKKGVSIFVLLTVAGCIGSPLLQTIALYVSKKYFGVDLNVPGGIQAVAALLISTGPWWIPRAWPLFCEYVLRRKPTGEGHAEPVEGGPK